MHRPAPTRATFLTAGALALAAVACGCTSAPIPGTASQAPDGPYRERLIDQLDLPLPVFDNWEIVDAARQPTRQDRHADVRDISPQDCAVDATSTRAADDVIYGGTRWTGAQGSGPNGQAFTVSVHASNPAQTDDLTDYLSACAQTEFETPSGRAKSMLARTSAVAQAGFDEVIGFSEVRTRGQQTTSGLTVVGRANSLALVLVFTNSGDLDTADATAVWKAAAEKFGKNG